MNYLVTVVFVLLLSACSTENQPIEEELEASKYRAAETQEQTVYLELDFHQAFLVWEEQQIRDEIVRIEEELENEGEGHELLEQLLQRLERNRVDHQRNEQLLDRYLRGPIGGGRPGRPCGMEPNPFGICPPPKRHLRDIYLYNDHWEKGSIELLTRDGEVCGEMVAMGRVSGGDEQFSRAIIDFDEEAAAQIRFNKLSESGELFSYTLPIK